MGFHLAKRESRSTGAVRTGSASNGLEGLRFSTLEGGTISLRLGNLVKKSIFGGKKGMAKTHGKGIVIGSRPISGPNSKLVRNKHEVVWVVERYDASKRKENNVFHFGESSIVCSNTNIQSFRDGNVQQKKPLDCELVGSTNLIVEVTTMKGIMWGIE
ncbi:hypothetical protein Golob_017554 [Gossypium lobatum]|uniref:Uncharacterized protein n=1 Tax=Gossypium lobatum TaxID=34289 RepID=A0A7J8M7R6_9ROSI|nr:hypothetical protein [Gossypium lobatum]